MGFRKGHNFGRTLLGKCRRSQERTRTTEFFRDLKLTNGIDDDPSAIRAILDAQTTIESDRRRAKAFELQTNRGYLVVTLVLNLI